MTDTPTQALTSAIQATFEDRPWTSGDLLRKATVRRALGEILSQPPHQIKTTDLKNLTNRLWETGQLEIIPPRDRERSFKFRLKAHPKKVELPEATQVASVEKTFPSHPAAVDETLILSAYTRLRQETQFRHVYLSDLCELTGLGAEIIHLWAKAKARGREFELGQADWSLATGPQREASLKINGIHYLTVGLL